ncbi:hypothetical protein HPP92_000834 [Vanilla planifolia]|uniref:Uncharacterized protein n=1 Tax=Vanilla planifolia TaxID=51239 RepID=A0A835SBW7_VANPL|nr:hypothetical protein HPP92_000834 [Vanilla planifolia]
MGFPGKTSSMYCTMMRDSQMALPSCSSTGIFLCTGFDFRSSSLLSWRFCSRNSYSISFSASAILHRMPKGLAQKIKQLYCLFPCHAAQCV